AAQVALDPSSNLFVGRRRIVLEQIDGGHDHAGGAVAALQAVLLPEALLDRVEHTVLRQALDRHDVRPVGLHGEDGAGLHGFAINGDGASPALTGVAADVG